MTNYLLQNLFICAFVNLHFIFFHQIFKTTVPTCLGVQQAYAYGSTDTFYSSSSSVLFFLMQFTLAFVTSMVLLFIVTLLHLIMVLRTENIRYTRIFNPILMLLPFLIGYTLIARVGIISNYYYPR